MIVGSYPFEDPEEPINFKKTIEVSDITTFLTNKMEQKLDQIC